MIDKVSCNVLQASYTEQNIPDPNSETSSSKCVATPTPNYFLNVTVTYKVSKETSWRNSTLCNLHVMDECWWCQNSQPATLMCQKADEYRQRGPGIKRDMSLFACQSILTIDLSSLLSYQPNSSVDCWVNKRDPTKVFLPFDDVESLNRICFFCFSGVTILSLCCFFGYKIIQVSRIKIDKGELPSGLTRFWYETNNESCLTQSKNISTSACASDLLHVDHNDSEDENQNYFLIND
jgi:hypothetical protein